MPIRYDVVKQQIQVIGSSEFLRSVLRSRLFITGNSHSFSSYVHLSTILKWLKN